MEDIGDGLFDYNWLIPQNDCGNSYECPADDCGIPGGENFCQEDNFIMRCCRSPQLLMLYLIQY